MNLYKIKFNLLNLKFYKLKYFFERNFCVFRGFARAERVLNYEFLSNSQGTEFG